MKNRRFDLTLATLLLCLAAAAPSTGGAADGDGSSPDDATGGLDGLLLSGRMELIYLHSFTGTIREDIDEHGRFYFNNIFLNLEGDLGPRASFIVEFQPLTSDLYLLGGYLTIAEALEGIGLEEADPRKVAIDQLISERIRELDEASGGPTFERAAITFFPTDRIGISLGRVRNPFGFWDDYSIFRNLSALKTDPISLGVALRRADLGLVLFGDAGSISYKLGVLQGGNTLTNRDDNDYKDLVFQAGTSRGRLDLAGSAYLHDVGSSRWTHGLGLSYRYRPTYNLSLLGELVLMDNDAIEVQTKGFYVQANYDLGDRVAEGLRWNMFFETYDSDLLDVDLEPGLDYRFAGTYFQASTGFVYAYNRSIDLGAKILSGADEEGDPFFKAAVKIDAKF